MPLPEPIVYLQNTTESTQRCMLLSRVCLGTAFSTMEPRYALLVSRGVGSRAFNWGRGVNRAPQNWGGGGAVWEKGSIDRTINQL